jgi:hypothetical protein
MIRSMPRIFLSYSHEDKPIAQALARELEERHAAVWFDEHMLVPGDRLTERIAEAIRSSDVFLLLISPASEASKWTRRELELALADPYRTRVVPVVFAGAKVPTNLSDILYLTADWTDLGATAERVLGSTTRRRRTEETFAAKEIRELLAGFNVVWHQEPSIAGVRPDFVVETPNGKRLIIEIKGRSDPSLLDAVAARTQAAALRELTGADDAVVVFPKVETALPAVGIVGLAEFSEYLRRFIASPPIQQISGSRPQASESIGRKTVFASMPFAPQYEDVYWVAMTFAAESVGATCVRVDREDFDGDIPDKIRSYIESSIAVIADLSESNADVLYELGYAKRHGCPCVQICSTSLENLPFNVRNVNTLKYSQGQTYELRDPLSERLTAAINGR